MAKAKKKKIRCSRIKKAVTRKSVKKSRKVKPAKKLPRSELKKYKELLFKERQSVGGDLSNIAQYTLNKSQREASGDLSGYSYHMADVASDNYDVEFSLGRATEEQKSIYAIDEALKRIEDGTYGLCLQCGKPITKSRLKAIPYTELCIECKKNNEGA